VASELRRVREGVRERALVEQSAQQVLGAPLTARTPQPVEPATPAPLPPPPPRPDLGPLGAMVASARAAVGFFARLTRGSEASRDEQVQINALQLEFNHAVLEYVEGRLAHTHAHYDQVLGVHGRHMGEIDERHLILQEELVAHVHDLVRRVDLVLAASEKGRVGQEFALRDLRARLTQLEEKITGQAATRE